MITLENAVVIVLVASAAVWVAVRLHRSLTRRQGGCAGCTGPCRTTKPRVK